MGVKVGDIRGMNHDDKLKLLAETRGELMHERGLAAMGGAPKNPGRIRDLRRTIARVLTLLREEEIRTGARLATVQQQISVEVPAPRRGRRGARTARTAPKAEKKTAKVGRTKAETAAAKEKIKKESKRAGFASKRTKRTEE